MVLGYNVVSGSHVRIWNLLFDGPTGMVHAPTSADPKGEDVLLWLDAPDVQLFDSEVTGDLWHAGVYVTGADGDEIVGNYIHGNGDSSDPTQANEDQGIYWGDGSGLVAGNLITDNVSFGVQLYPGASGVRVQWNTIAANDKAGVVVGDTASQNTIANNIVADNQENGIRSSGLTGTGNLVQSNDVWGNGSGNLGQEADGLTLQNNQQLNPQFQSGSYAPSQNSPIIRRAGFEAVVEFPAGRRHHPWRPPPRRPSHR